MSRVFLYEPMYDLERLFDEACIKSTTPARSKSLKRRRPDSDDDTPSRSIRPRMDLHEDERNNLVTATFDLPGVKKDSVNIQLTHNGQLTISAEAHKPEGKDKLSQDGFIVKERRSGKYSRTLTVAQGLSDQDVKASLEDGVLTLKFPRVSPQQAPKKIHIA